MVFAAWELRRELSVLSEIGFSILNVGGIQALWTKTIAERWFGAAASQGCLAALYG